MGSSDEDWKISAMTDVAVVAELLLSLNQVTPEPPHPPPNPALSLEWTVRQPRSKAVTVGKKPGPRASPTTPLSWSGATSNSGGGGGGGGSGASCAGFDVGSEESSKPPTVHHPKPSTTTRSVKATSGGTPSKRPRRKKTLAELKEEEVVLLKERRQLKKKLTTIRVNLEMQRATNEKLKKMKLDLQSQPANGRGTAISSQEDDVSNPPAPASSLMSSSPLIKSCSEARTGLPRLVLPDLNLPFEEDCNTEVSCRAS